LTSNSLHDVRVKQKNITLNRFKKISFVLICLATLLLILDIIDIKMVFGKREVGLWDHMPSLFRQTMFLAYPILLATSYALFIVTIKIKSKLDFVPNILFLLNVLVIVLLLVIYVTELVKHL
jgi:hypothetical protein